MPKKEVKKGIGEKISVEIDRAIEKGCKDEKKELHKHHHHNDGCGAFYGIGVIGAAVYYNYISHATGFWMGVLGVLKALVWPAFVVYKVMEILGL